jgi:tetratricopeptide (TPR) repeat protein
MPTRCYLPLGTAALGQAPLPCPGVCTKPARNRTSLGPHPGTSRLNKINDLGGVCQEVWILAHAYKQTGARDDAKRALDDALKTAERQGDQSLLLRVREVELIIDVTGRPRSERIRDLEALRILYTDAADLFEAARVGTLVTAEYIFGGDYSNAARISRDALEVFTNVGDEFGIRIARLNLAAALRARHKLSVSGEKFVGRIV